MNKTEFLNFLKTLGEFKLHYYNKKTNLAWKHPKEIELCSEKELEESNLRTILSNEIVLDEESIDNLNKIKQQLKKNKLYYYIYSTGSRGFHVSLFFKDLNSHELITRNQIRKIFIKKYNCDESKSSEKTLLALEYSKHFKTEKEKTLIEENPGINELDISIVNEAKQLLDLNSIKDITSQKDDLFKNYHSVDPYFKYISVNKIEESQERNNVVFKNIAIALVKEGLSDAEINEIVNNIIENFPGQTINAIMGWIKKARNGEITDYNINEINRWCEKYSHPVFYDEIIETKEVVKTMSSKQLWDEYFSNDIILQQEWRDILFFSLIGCVIDETEDDLRVHAFLSCDSTSGKTEGILKVKKILEKLKLNSVIYITATDRNLVGSLNDEALKYNNRKNLSETDQDYRDPVSYGTLSDHQLIGFPEAERILETGAFNRDTQNILRTAMDKDREITKGLGSKVIKFNTNSTFLFGCYPSSKAIKNILHTGLFQRVFFIHKHISTQDHQQIMQSMLKRNSSSLYLKRENIYENELVSRLEKLKTEWQTHRNTFYEKFQLSIELQRYIQNKINQIEEEFYFLDKKDLCDLNASERRGIILIYKILKIIAFLKRNDFSIDKKDVEYVLNLYKNNLNSLKDVLLETTILRKSLSDSKLQRILNIIKNKRRVTRTHLYKLVENLEGLKSMTARVKAVSELIESGLIEEIIEDKERFLVIKDE